MKRGFVDTPDGQLHYWEEGSGDPLLLLHLTPDPRCFHPTIPYLSGTRRVISIDLPGYGDSARPPQPYTEIAEFATAILRVADGLGLDTFDLLGHMTGANVAAEVASMQPQRVRRLILSELVDWGAAGLVGVHGSRFPAPEPEADGSHLIKVWNQYSGMLGEVTMDDVQRRFYVLYQALYAGPLTGGEIYGSGSWAAAAPYTIERQDLADRLPKITAETYIICGGAGVLRSGANPRLDRERLTALLPNGRSKLLEELPHVAPFTHPKEFAAVVNGFLAGN